MKLKGGLLMKRLYNILLGFTITFGKCIFALFIIAMIFDKSIMNYDNTLFILITSLAAWVMGFIYEFNVNRFIKLLGHSIALYLVGVISFYFIYGIEILKCNFFVVSGVYWSFYLVFYVAGIYYNNKVDADLNNSVEYIKKLEDMYVNRGDKDE